MMRALLLKDLRLHSAAWAFCWLLLVGGAWLSLSPRFRFGVPLLLGTMGLIACVALLGTVYFAGEVSSGTESFLFGFPLRRRTVWLSRALPVATHAACAAGLCAATLRHAVATVPELAEVWNYSVPNWLVLVATGRVLPYLAVLSVLIVAGAASVCRTTRQSCGLFLLCGAAIAFAYAVLATLSGTLPDTRAGTDRLLLHLDWLVACELIGTFALAALAAVRAFCRTAPLESGLRGRRAVGRALADVVVLAAIVCPFHCWANRTAPRHQTLGAAAWLSPDRQKVVLQATAAKLGRVFDSRLWAVDLARPSVRFLARGSKQSFLPEGSLLFRAPSFLGWPRFARVAVADLNSGTVTPLAIPGLLAAERLRPKVSQDPEIHPVTHDLLLTRRRHRNAWARDGWSMRRDGSGLRKLLPLSSRATVNWVQWHPDGRSAYVNVSGGGAQQGLWWVPIPGTGDGGGSAAKPRKLRSEGTAHVVDRSFSADGRWLCLPYRQRAADAQETTLTVSRSDGSRQWELSVTNDLRVSYAWAPKEAWLAMVEVVPSGQFTVSLCDPASRRIDAVATLASPFGRAHPSAIEWSADGTRLLLTLRASERRPPSPASPFQDVRVKQHWALCEVALRDGTTRVVYGPATHEFCVLARDSADSRMESARQVARPQPLGYDAANHVLLLVGRKLLRIDPDTGSRETVLTW